jgi:DMSO reductase family type II enzyme chaperone
MTKRRKHIASASREVSLASDLLRAGLYKLFSVAFLFPTREVVEYLSDLAERIEALCPQRDGLWAALANYLRSAEFLSEKGRLSSAYDGLFHHECGLSLYESEYRHGGFRRVECLADVSGFYRAFGLEPERERHDHISVELEFMHALVCKEIAAEQEEQRKVVLDVEGKFLAEHLAPWVPVLAAAISERARSGFYAKMAAFLSEFLEDELRRLGVKSERRVAPELSDELETDFECPLAQVCAR